MAGVLHLCFWLTYTEHIENQLKYDQNCVHNFRYVVEAAVLQTQNLPFDVILAVSVQSTSRSLSCNTCLQFG